MPFARRTLVATAVVASACLAQPAAAHPACANVVGVGDSVMLGAAARLRAKGVAVDAAVGRQWARGATRAARHARPGTTVVLHLATNGPISAKSVDALLKKLKRNRRVVLVTAQLPDTRRFRYEAANNRILRAAQRRHRNVVVADWNAVSRRPGLLARDGIHLTASGARAYANLVTSTAC